jgi:hypothetical protein
MPRADKAKPGATAGLSSSVGQTGEARLDKPTVAPSRLSREATDERGSDVARWLPADEFWAELPPNIREPALRILPKTYRHFVLDAPNHLERSVGATLVHLTWLELCGQVRLAQVMASPNALDILDSPEQMIDRHLRLVKAKCQTVALLAKLKAMRDAPGRWPAALQPALDPLPLDAVHHLLPAANSTAAQTRRASPPATQTVSPPPSPLSPTTAPLKLENRPVVDQLDHPALRLLAAQPELFLQQGSVIATWRRRNGKTFGPYYRLSYRSGGRQYAIYLGRTGALVEQVRDTLATLQRPRTERREFKRLERQVRASLRIEKISLRKLLYPYGLRLKGNEIRGWRHLFRFRKLLPPRRRLMPRLCLRTPRFPKRLGNDAVGRMRRFLEARDGHAPADDIGTMVELPRQLRDNGSRQSAADHTGRAHH